MTSKDKPKAAERPKLDGFFWVKWADKKYIYNKDRVISGQTWNIGSWELIRIEDGVIDCFGTDEVVDWDNDWHVVVEVGPKVERPE